MGRAGSRSPSFAHLPERLSGALYSLQTAAHHMMDKHMHGVAVLITAMLIGAMPAHILLHEPTA